MKAVLVIDVEEHGDYYADVYRKDADDRFEGRYYLKPLPQKKDIDKTLEFGGYENIIQESLARGYNACLEEIQNDN